MRRIRRNPSGTTGAAPVVSGLAGRNTTNAEPTSVEAATGGSGGSSGGSSSGSSDTIGTPAPTETTAATAVPAEWNAGNAGNGAIQPGRSYVHPFETTSSHGCYCASHEAASRVGAVVVGE